MVAHTLGTMAQDQIRVERAEDDAHLPSDIVDGIDVEKLAFSGEVLPLTVSWLASR